MSDNNLPASKRKVDKAKRQGQVARAPELVSETTLLWGLFMLSLVLGANGAVVQWFGATLKACLDASTDPLPGRAAVRALSIGVGPVLALLGLIAAGSLFLNLAVHQVVSGGTSVSWEALGPNFDRLNPFEGVKKLFNGGAWGTAQISLLKMLVALGALFLMLPATTAGILTLSSAAPGAILGLVVGRMLSIGFSVAGLLAAFAVLQAFWSRKRWTDELKMSHQEAVEDTKESEGNPQTRRRFRIAHRRLARRRTMQAVAACDVVLANPTHFAVALRYKKGRMRAPRVMAKGADLMAERIKETARSLGIPVVEQAPLARELYANVQVGREIPTRLYRAVAKIIHQIRGLSPAPAATARGLR
jgi:flagellar biosynthetic protein FlhB